MAQYLVKSLFPKLLVFVLAFQLSVPAFAQNGVQTDPLVSKPRRQITTIIFAGLAGAILGLSTLSFYGRPQEKLSNIAVGFAVGVIIGAVYTTYQTATRPYDYMDVRLIEEELYPRENMNLAQKGFTPSLSYQWQF